MKYKLQFHNEHDAYLASNELLCTNYRIGSAVLVDVPHQVSSDVNRIEYKFDAKGLPLTEFDNELLENSVV